MTILPKRSPRASSRKPSSARSRPSTTCETTGVIWCCAMKSVAAWRSAFEPIVEPTCIYIRESISTTKTGKEGEARLTDELLITQDLAHRKRCLWRYRHPAARYAHRDATRDRPAARSIRPPNRGPSLATTLRGHFSAPQANRLYKSVILRLCRLRKKLAD